MTESIIHKSDSLQRIGLASDHAGFALKVYILKMLIEAGCEVIDFGNTELNPDDDYPDYIIPLAQAIAQGTVLRGIAFCGSGVGASIAANKVPGVRAALIHDHFSAHQGVEDDDMNMLCIGGQVTGMASAKELVMAFLKAQFSGEDRHMRRLQKIKQLENNHNILDMKQNKIRSIHDFGQSIWLDLLDREIMNSGELKRMIDEDGIRGLTSNPAIFEKAISHSSLYDDDIAMLSQKETSNEEIFFGLAVKDIKRAADIFSPLYEKSFGGDGFVSLEVSPHLAHDTEGTINQANKLWKAVDRKNVMIKIPGTAEGLLAIRKCIREGININVTLLFGLPRYREVTNAYLSGLEDRVKANQPIENISSVASFFLSRIDVMVDPMLMEKKLSNLKGEVAIASAKKAYEIYQEVFNSERFKKLEAKGAKPQRVLWASTSSKDPSFSDVKYVEALIGKETINTIPMETLEAFRDHGQAANRLEDNLDKASNVLESLKENEISIDRITQKLEDEGIEKFNAPYDKLLAGIEKQMQKQMTPSN